MKLSPFFLLPLIGFAAGWLAGSSADTAMVRPATEPAAPTRRDTKIEEGGNRAPATEHGNETRPLPAIPVETLRAALNHPSLFHRLGAMAPLFQNLSAAQFSALRAEFATLDPPPDAAILALFYQRWAQAAPEAAVDATVEEHLKGNLSFWQPALLAWGESDPDAALARFEKLTFVSGFFARSTRDLLRELAMPKPGQLPPAQAVRRIRELQGDGESTPAIANSMAAILREWVKTDPQAAWAEALAIPSAGHGGETQEWALSALLHAQTNIDPRVAEQWIDALPNSAQREKLEADYASDLEWAGKPNQARQYV